MGQLVVILGITTSKQNAPSTAFSWEITRLYSPFEKKAHPTAFSWEITRRKPLLLGVCSRTNYIAALCMPVTPRLGIFVLICVSHEDQPFITKTCLYNSDPLKPHFYIVKLRFTGVYIIFLISTQSIDCGYSLEPPRRGGSNEYPQSMFCAEM